jgi:flagellar basal-body rod protein FlgB
MDVTRIGPMALAERRIGWLEQRQRVLAQNIANADTPGYRPRDLTPFGQVLAAAAPDLVRTAAGHQSGPRGAASGRPDRAAVEVSPDGNAVSLDREALKVAETDQAHALAFALHRRWAAMFRAALGRGA